MFLYINLCYNCMGNLTKNIPKPEQDVLNVPEGLIRRKNNAIRAGYNFEFDEREKNYITYNKLRTERQDKEIIQIAKMYRLKNRDNGEEFLVWYQTSKTYDYDNNLIPCPQVEKIGIENNPQTTTQKNAQNQITDIQLIETHNDFYIPFSSNKVIELFDKSRNSQNITCYVGYCKPVQEIGTDYITDKKRIYNQNSFINEQFDNLIEITDEGNKVGTYSKINKTKTKTESKQISAETHTSQTKKDKPIKSLKEVQQEKENNKYGQVENEGEDYEQMYNNNTQNTEFKIGSLD